jgi:uncharacterized protein YcfJ
MTLRHHFFGLLIGLAALAGSASAASAQVVITDSPRVHGVQIVRHSPHRVRRVRHTRRRVVVVHRSSVRPVRHSHVRHVYHRG